MPLVKQEIGLEARKLTKQLMLNNHVVLDGIFNFVNLFRNTASLSKEEFEWHWNLGMFSTSRFRLRDSSAGFRLGTCNSCPFLAAWRAKRTAGLVLVLRERGEREECKHHALSAAKFCFEVHSSSQVPSRNLKRVMFYD